MMTRKVLSKKFPFNNKEKISSSKKKILGRYLNQVANVNIINSKKCTDIRYPQYDALKSTKPLFCGIYAHTHSLNLKMRNIRYAQTKERFSKLY